MPKRKRHAERAKRERSAVPVAPAAKYRIAQTAEDVTQLADWLQDPARETPVVLISRDEATGAPLTDPERVAEEPADVWLLEPDATFAFTDIFDRSVTVYGGASRIFPVGTEWRTDCLVSPRFLPNLGARQQTSLLAELERMTRPSQAQDLELDSGGYTMLRTLAEAQALARELLSDSRTDPVVIITISRSATEPYVDAANVANELAGFARVYVMETNAVSWAFSDLLPPGGDIYGGASRVYPPGSAWANDVYSVPIRFANNTDEGERTAELLISDALRHAPPIEHQSATSIQTEQASGIVTGVIAGQALVSLDDGQIAHCRPELVAGGIGADRVFTAGQRVEGTYHPRQRRLDPTRQSAKDVLAEIAVSDVILVRAVSIKRDQCLVEPFPGFRVEISTDQVTGDAQIDLRGLMTVGEVFPVVVQARGERPAQWRLSGLVPDGVEPREAPALLPGGPPWLAPAEETELFAEPSRQWSRPALDLASPPLQPPPVPVPAVTPNDLPPSIAVPVPDTETRELRDENTRLMRQIQDQDREIEGLNRDVERHRTRIRQLVAKEGKAKRDLEAAQAAARVLDQDLERFDDPLDQLRFEVYLAWVRRFSDADRKTRPMARWNVSPHFFSSWEETQGVERRKVVDVIVEVLTGLDIELTGRERHQLRTGPGGDDPPRTRGADTAWRVSLQVNTPSARRLHYWRLPDGTIELSSIRLHDDFRD